MRMRFSVFILCGTILFLGACLPQPTPTPIPTPTITPMPKIFDGKFALNAYLVPQMNFGARPAGSASVRALASFIAEQFGNSKWKVETQDFSFRGIPGRNVIAKIGEGKGPLVVIGAHYDTRIYADQDQQN
jgi:glutaminyl-peptide cyclotransferase